MKIKYLIWDSPIQAIYTIMIILLFVGGINIFSASFIESQKAYLIKYIIFAILGLLSITMIRRIGYKRILQPKILWGGYLLVLIMLIAVDVIGVVNKGAARWLSIGPLSIQPSEMAKLVIIMITAYYLGISLRKNMPVYLHKHVGLGVVLATLTYAGLVYKQPDLGTAAIIVALMMGIFIIAGISLKQVWIISGIGVGGAILATIMSPYRLARVKVWFDPWIDQQGDGYQMVQSLLAIGSGGLTGSIWGQGVSKFHYLPEAHTDFAFAVFCQENGFIGSLLLMIAFAILAGAFCRIVFLTRDSKGFLLASGITLFIIGQAVANMAMVCGILPVIGVPLTFISYGGSSMVTSMIAIGLLLSVYDEEFKRLKQDKISPEERRNNLHILKNRG